MKSLNLTPKQMKARKKMLREKYKQEHPILVRRTNKLNSRKYREKNPERIKEYNSNYFKDWLKNPVNYASHRARTLVGTLKIAIIKGAKMRQANLLLLSWLEKAGWSADLSKDECLNHIISLKLIYSFDSEMDDCVVFDPMNLEIITKIENNSAKKRKVTKSIVDIASRLEKKYSLKGFTKFIQKHEGEII